MLIVKGFATPNCYSLFILFVVLQLTFVKTCTVRIGTHQIKC